MFRTTRRHRGPRDLLRASAPSTPADDEAEAREIRGAGGFGGHNGATCERRFDRLPDEPIGVGAAWMSPREKADRFTLRARSDHRARR